MEKTNLVTLKEKTKNPNGGYIFDHSEAYRHLRTNIEFSAFNSEINVLVVTSANAAEGKSTTSCNLAVVMASHRQRVLLIDCDLRIPDIHRQFQVSNATGLSDALLNFKSEGFNVLKYVQQIKHPNISNDLYLMTAGPIVPNPAEMLSSKRFREFIEFLKLRFDMIIMDGPPVLPVPDAIPVGLAADGMLFCVASEQTKKEHAKVALTQCKRAGINVIGTCVTMIKEERNSYYSYNYNNLQNKTLGQQLKLKRKKTRSAKKSKSLSQGD
ncbi:MAG: CpsD/CapB family tyrosine-protein kinase [Erysipelotrichaceae bacterium]|nr:CpsD/CapB family tyrosine-protein kinase [Erysipelotrichaceae bacterium]